MSNLITKLLFTSENKNKTITEVGKFSKAIVVDNANKSFTKTKDGSTYTVSFVTYWNTAISGAILPDMTETQRGELDGTILKTVSGSYLAPNKCVVILSYGQPDASDLTAEELEEFNEETIKLAEPLVSISSGFSEFPGSRQVLSSETFGDGLIFQFGSAVPTSGLIYKTVYGTRRVYYSDETTITETYSRPATQIIDIDSYGSGRNAWSTSQDSRGIWVTSETQRLFVSSSFIANPT